MEHEPLAMEMLKELKVTTVRWFVAFVVMVVLELATIGGFLWYVSLPVEESYSEVQQEASDRSFNMINNSDGGITDVGTPDN